MKDEQHSNGKLQCPFAVQSEEVREHLYSTAVLVKEMHENMNALIATSVENSKYLANLEKLEALDGAVDAVKVLAGAVTGKNSAEARTTLVVSLILGAVIIGLTIIIVFLLTGEHSGWIQPLYNHHP
jgi:hypothetical protein